MGGVISGSGGNTAGMIMTNFSQMQVGSQFKNIIAESKGIQTSIQRMNTSSLSQESREELKQNPIQAPMIIQREYVDASIQMTFEEPPEDLIRPDSVVNRNQLSHHDDEDNVYQNNDEDDDDEPVEVNNEDVENVDRFLSHQDSSISVAESVNHQQLHIQSGRSLNSPSTDRNNIHLAEANQRCHDNNNDKDEQDQQNEDMDDQNMKECTQGVPFLSPIQEPAAFSHQHTHESENQAQATRHSRSNSNSGITQRQPPSTASVGKPRKSIDQVPLVQTSQTPKPMMSPQNIPLSPAQSQHQQIQHQKQSHDLNASQPNSNQSAQLTLDQQQQFEQLKIKYQRQLMQEYTSIVEKMSKDVFDANFLKNFQLFTPGHLQQTFDQPHQTMGGNMMLDTITNNHASALAASFQMPYSPTHCGNNLSMSQQQQQTQSSGKPRYENGQMCVDAYNLNISIYNNAQTRNQEDFDKQAYTPNYNPIPPYQSPPPALVGTPVPMGQIPLQAVASQTQQFAASQFMNNTAANIVNPLNQTMKIPLKNGIKSPVTGVSTMTKSTPTGQNSQVKSAANFKHQVMSNSGPGSAKKAKPQTAGAYQQQPYSYENSAAQSLNNSKDLKQRPQSSGTNSHQLHLSARQANHKMNKNVTAFKKPQNFIHLQIESADNAIRSQTPIALQSQGQDIPTSVKHNNYTNNLNQMTMKGLHNHQGVYSGQSQLKIKSSMNSPHLAQYVNTMPNSVKHNQQKMYTYQNQQQAHQKVVKASAINKNQNKVILQSILNDNGLMMGGGTIANQKTGTYEMTIHPSVEGGRLGSMNTHHKTKSQPNAPGIYQWSTANCTGPNEQQNSGAVYHTREKSNEHMQNEILRMIVEEGNSFQQQQIYQQAALVEGGKLVTLPWSQATPQSNHQQTLGGPTQSFNTKRSSLPQNTGYSQNFNILDSLKHQQPQTPQYQPYPQLAQMRPQSTTSQGSQHRAYIQQIAAQTPNTDLAQFNLSQGYSGSNAQQQQLIYSGEIKPQASSFGSLVTHQKAQSFSGTGNIVLDLHKLNAGNPNILMNYSLGRPNDLCTIEESKRSEPLQESQDYYNANPLSQTIEPEMGAANSHQSLTVKGSKQRPLSSGSIGTNNGSWHGRKTSQQQSNFGAGSSISYHSQSNSQCQAQNRCQPHDIEEQ